MLVYDRKTRAVFEASQIGDKVFLKGLNFKGTFRLNVEQFKNPENGLATITEKKADKLEYKGGWPIRLSEILLIKTKVTSITLNFDKPVKPKKEKPTIVKETPKEPTKVKVKKSTPKSSQGGETTLAQICEQVGISPTAARGRLRGNIDKPAAGWKWTDQKEVDKIIKFLGGK